MAYTWCCPTKESLLIISTEGEGYYIAMSSRLTNRSINKSCSLVMCSEFTYQCLFKNLNWTFFQSAQKRRSKTERLNNVLNESVQLSFPGLMFFFFFFVLSFKLGVKPIITHQFDLNRHSFTQTKACSTALFTRASLLCPETSPPQGPTATRLPHFSVSVHCTVCKVGVEIPNTITAFKRLWMC